MKLVNILAKTSEYLQTSSVVRFEHLFMEHLASDFDISNYQVKEYDRLLVISKKNSKNPKILTAHIDRHGIVVNQEGKFEYAAFQAKKYYGMENTSSEEIFQKAGKRFVGELVYAHDSAGKVLGEGKVINFSYDFDKKDLFFEIDGLKKLPAETVVAYQSPLIHNDSYVSSQLDNVVSVAVIYQLIQDGFDGKVIFSTEEEIGRSWQHIVDYLNNSGIKTQELITLDTTPYLDLKAIKEGLVVLRNKDENGEFNPLLVNLLREICKEGIEYEFKDEVIEAENKKLPEGTKPKGLGKTELGNIIKHTNGKFNGATIQIPTTGYHTNHETTSESALWNYYDLLCGLLQE